MKAIFEKIGEWLVAAFAMVMRTVFPTLSVKYFTKYKSSDSSCIIYLDEKERKEKAMRYLPSVEAQLRAISKLQLTEEEIRCRVWSRETMKELFRQGNFALISTLTGADEDLFDVIVKSGNSKKTAEAFAKATPKAYYLREFLNTASNAVTVFKLAPQAFNALDYSDIPEGRKREFLGTILQPAMEERSKAEKAAIQSWAEKVYEALVGRDEPAGSQVVDDDKFLFEAAVKMLVKSKDLSKDFWLIRGKHPQAYGLLIEATREGKAMYIASYLRKALPEAKKALAGGDVEFSKTEAYDWLDVAMSNIDNPDVQGAILASLEDELAKAKPGDNVYNIMQAFLVNNVRLWCHVKQALRVLPKIFSGALEKKLVASVYNAESAEESLSLVSPYYGDELFSRMIGYTDHGKTSTLLKYFPFITWKHELAEKAVRKLAELQALPMDKFAELPEDLQKVAEEELEIGAQLKCLTTGKSDTVKAMLKQQLHPEAEAYLFNGSYHFYGNNYVEEYLSNNRVAESSFRVLCNVDRDCQGYGIRSLGVVPGLIQLYAEKHGLTPQNYRDLMSGGYAYVAPILKQYVADVVVSGEDAEDDEVEVIGGGELDGGNSVVINCEQNEATGA